MGPFWGPYNKDYSILGSILGYPNFGKPSCRFRVKYCSQNAGKLYKDPHYKSNLSIETNIITNLGKPHSGGRQIQILGSQFLRLGVRVLGLQEEKAIRWLLAI